ncbi:MAG: hypothetical protein LBD08_08350 [Treponema sp.]|jgi:hypothetical protein|nr:hypothetical protein [Treponema sp.]
MRKFFVGLILILILGGTAFFFGWAQLTVPPGSYGVMRSKTHGIDAGLIREGEFRWVWYKLIPANVSITLFTPSHIERLISVRGVLPQADSYKTFLGLDARFSYEVSASLSFSIKPEALAALVSGQGLTSQETLQDYEGKLAAALESFAEQRLRVYAEEGDTLMKLLETGSPERLLADIRHAYPDLENLFCAVRASTVPDFALYQSARSLYEEYLQRQRELLAAEVRESAGRRLESQFRFDELARYGELLTKYPILLEYLALGNR